MLMNGGSCSYKFTNNYLYNVSSIKVIIIKENKTMQLLEILNSWNR